MLQKRGDGALADMDTNHALPQGAPLCVRTAAVALRVTGASRCVDSPERILLEEQLVAFQREEEQ